MTPEQLQDRLDRLERRQSRMLRAGTAVIVMLTAGAVMAQVAPPRTPPGTHSLPIAASRFDLVDPQGQTRAVLRMDNGAPVLQLHDADGVVALKLTVRGTDGTIEYSDRGEVLNLMRPAHRVRPLTSR